jgi:hypothetical protein
MVNNWYMFHHGGMSHINLKFLILPGIELPSPRAVVSHLNLSCDIMQQQQQYTEALTAPS